MSLKKTLATSRMAHFLAQKTPLLKGVGERYVPAVVTEDAIEIAKELQEQGFLVCMHHLGAATTRPDDIKENVAQILEVMELLDEENLNQCISLSPSELGFLRSTKAGEGYSKQIARNFRSRMQATNVEQRHGVTDENLSGPLENLIILHASQRVPMQKLMAQNASYVRAGLDSVVTIPSALFRSIDDVKTIISQGDKARLSLIPEMITDARYFTEEEDILDNYMKLARLLLSEDAMIQQVYTVFALDDEEIANQIKEIADLEGWRYGDFEFEIPYGANDELAHTLREEGYSVRILLPWGREWWPYYVKMSQSSKD